jgi:RimJ/RimL family protein N-acetyltransferase
VPDARIEEYESAVKREFASRKSGESHEAALASALPIGDGRGLLVPLSAAHLQDDRLIATLARWRWENSRAFATRFPAEVEGTRDWLWSSVLGVDDRILFLVCDSSGRAIGHVGLADALNRRREIEIDNVLRGERSEPGLMAEAIKALTDWVEHAVAPARLHLRVLSDNERAIAFYRRLGWREDGRQPLTEERDGDREILRPARDGERVDAWFVRMVYERG